MGDIDLRCGDWRDVLADVEQVDALITDPPYSERVHRAGALIEGADDAERSADIGYECLSHGDVCEIVEALAPRVRGWMCFHTSHDLVWSYEAALAQAGRYVFPPVPCVMKGMSVRLQGDGPSSWTCWLVVSRPRTKEAMAWGTLPGAYVGKPPHARRGTAIVMGQKPEWLMEAIVRDYTRQDDLVCDPFSGGGTTAIACEALGRRFVGAEIDPETHEKALARIKRGVQIDMFGGAA